MKLELELEDVREGLNGGAALSLPRTGSDSLRLMGGGAVAAVSMVLKAFSLSWNLLSLTLGAGLGSFSWTCTRLLVPEKLAIFCRIVSETSDETLRAGWTKVSIFCSHSSSFFLISSFLGGEEAEDKEEVAEDGEDSLLEVERGAGGTGCWERAKFLYPSIALW